MISDKDYDERGTYVARLNGHVVPYPSRVPGTDMYERVQQAAALAETPKAPRTAPEPISKVQAIKKDLRSFRGRGYHKRKALDQPDGQPGSKKPTTRSAARAKDEDDDTENDTDDQPASRGQSSWRPDIVAPAKHIQGILATATAGQGEDSTAASPEASPDGEEDEEAKARDGSSDRSSSSYIPPRERTPEPPKGMCDPDDQGACLVQKGAKANNRIMVPPSFQFDDIEIGYRDSTNDSSKIKNPSARGKFLGKPNTGWFHYDALVWSYDARNQAEEDLDQDLVAKHQLHRRYGLFLLGSTNEQEPPAERCKDPKPIVFLTPSGKEVHASRSHITVATEMSNQQAETRRKLGSLLGTFCTANPAVKVPQLTDEQENFVPEELRGPSLGLDRDRYASRESEASVGVDPEAGQVGDSDVVGDFSLGGVRGLTPLMNAVLVAAAEESSTRLQPAKAASRPYDAIRDVFGSATPAAPAAEPPSFKMALLAEASCAQPRSPLPEPATLSQLAPPVAESKALLPESMGVPGSLPPFQDAAPLASAPRMPLAMPNQSPAQMLDRPPLPHEIPTSSLRESGLREPSLHEASPLRQPMQALEQPPLAEQHRSIMAAPPSAYEPRMGAAPYQEYEAPRQEELLHHLSQAPPPQALPPQGPASQAPPAPADTHGIEADVGRRPSRLMQDSMIDPEIMALENAHAHNQQPSYFGQPPNAAPQAQYASHLAPAPQPPPQRMHEAPMTSAGPLHGHPVYDAPPLASIGPPRNSFSSPSHALPPLRPPRQFDQPLASFMDATQSPRPSHGPPHNPPPFYGGPPSYHGGFGSAEHYHREPVAMNHSLPGGPPTGPPGPSPHQDYMSQGSRQAPYHQTPLAPAFGSGPPSRESLQSPPQVTSPIEMIPRPRTGSQSSPGGPNSKYPRLAPAPIPPHRMWNPEPQLRTVGYNPTQDIKDYSANEPLPNRGPSTIRSWNVNNSTTRKRAKASKDDKTDSQ